MKKQVLIYALVYGLCGGLLIAALKIIEYRFVVVEHSIEIYGGLTALIFASVGIWLGLKLTRKEQVIVERQLIVEKEVPVPTGTPFVLDEKRMQELAMVIADHTGRVGHEHDNHPFRGIDPEVGACRAGPVKLAGAARHPAEARAAAHRDATPTPD